MFDGHGLKKALKYATSYKGFMRGTAEGLVAPDRLQAARPVVAQEAVDESSSYSKSCIGGPMLLVADVMTRELLTLQPADSLKNARDIMQKARIRHLPVLTRAGNFIGLLSQRDLLKASVSHFADMDNEQRDQMEAAIPVSEVMSTEVLTVPPNLPLARAGELMLTHKFGCLPVLQDGNLLGILTESDFVKLCLAFLKEPEQDGDVGTRIS